MARRVSLAMMFRRLVAINAAAADAGEYEIAYHTLMAALHTAECIARDTGKGDQILEVAEIARAQGAVVERIKPPHQLSKSAAKNRGHSSVYETFQLHADSAHLRLKTQKRRAAAKLLWPHTAAR